MYVVKRFICALFQAACDPSIPAPVIAMATSVTLAVIAPLGSAPRWLAAAALLLSLAFAQQDASGPTFTYHSNEQLTEFLMHINNTYDITHLYSIGKSVQGKPKCMLIYS